MYDVTNLNDKELEKLEERIKREYEQAEKELKEKAQEYFDKYRERFKREQLAMETTTLSKEQIRAKWIALYGNDNGFDKWYKNADHAYGKTASEAQQNFHEWEMAQIGRGNHWEDMKAQMAQRLVEANQIAQGYTNNILPSMYCSESNEVARIGQESAMEQGVMGIRFDLVDEYTVARLMAGSREVRPYKKIEINLPRDKQWNLTKLQNALLQGILQGDSIDEIASRFEAVVGMDRASAIRNARTAVTGARSAGKQDRYNDLAKQGCVFTKIWVATADGRTRPEHAEADGQEVDYNLPFDVGGEELMYPADPDGSPWNIYNCRCTMQTGKPIFHSVLRNADRMRNEYAKIDNNVYSYNSDADEIAKAKEILDKIGFMGISNTTYKNIDSELLIATAQAISELERKFGVIGKTSVRLESNEPRDKEFLDAYGVVYADKYNPTRMTLSLCPSIYYSKDKMNEKMRDALRDKDAMPIDMSKISEYVITHEYGHIIENYMIGEYYKKYGWNTKYPQKIDERHGLGYDWNEKLSIDYTSQCKSEIIQLATEMYGDIDIESMLSGIAKENDKEFFAEVFVNSQLGKPNALGYAMQVWLERELK